LDRPGQRVAGGPVEDTDWVAVARAAAGRLAPQYGSWLESDVEAVIYEDGAQPPCQYVDPVALGSLLVSIATLGWQIYTDHMKRGERPAPDVVAQRIRAERRTERELTSAEETIIEVVSIEVVKRAGEG
jgi:hypothetical protein